jgi:CRISPR-associated protein Csh1
MFEECLEVFKRELDYDNNLILDEYIPADGSYIIVDAEGKIKNYQDIKLDKKKRGTSEAVVKGSYFKEICFYDYHSKLISMNKPIDSKVIHSNNYLSFAVKKESITSKLTEAIIDNYYDILKNPLEKKYKKSKEASKIYQNFEKEYSPVNIEILEKCRSWIKQHIFSIDKLVQIDLGKKDYLKIFFEVFEVNEEDNKNRELFIQEDNRYIYPNIYNKSEYIINVKKKVYEDTYGLPYYGINMNRKKPFLKIKTRKTFIPYLLDMDKALLQKQFFEYLMSLAVNGKNNIYIDIKNYRIRAYSDQDERKDFSEISSGYYLRIQKGKELEIQVQDNIVDYQNKLLLNFYYQDFFKMNVENYPEYTKDIGIHSKRTSVGRLINEIFFSKYLLTNYFTDASDISVKDSVLKRTIVMYRNVIFDWIYKGIDNNFELAERRFALDLIKNALINNYTLRAMTQLNLHWSFKDYFTELKQQGGEKMAEIATEIRESIKERVTSKEEVKMPINDKEYYYAVGQIAAYFISLSKAGKKSQSMINLVINISDDRVLKERLIQLYKKYNYAIDHYNVRFKNLFAMILGYKPDAQTDRQTKDEMILFGYMDSNSIYTKKEENN